MSSKRYEADRGTVWFPSRSAPKALWLHFNKRSRTIEITAMGNVEYFDTYRISLSDLLRGLGVAEDTRS